MDLVAFYRPRNCRSESDLGGLLLSFSQINQDAVGKAALFHLARLLSTLSHHLGCGTDVSGKMQRLWETDSLLIDPRIRS